jgi:hypothetical protein
LARALHAWHGPSQAVSQQTPLTQWSEAQSSGVAHVPARASIAPKSAAKAAIDAAIARRRSRDRHRFERSRDIIVKY